MSRNRFKTTAGFSNHMRASLEELIERDPKSVEITQAITDEIKAQGALLDYFKDEDAKDRYWKLRDPTSMNREQWRKARTSWKASGRALARTIECVLSEHAVITKEELTYATQAYLREATGSKEHYATSIKEHAIGISAASLFHDELIYQGIADGRLSAAYDKQEEAPKSPLHHTSAIYYRPQDKEEALAEAHERFIEEKHAKSSRHKHREPRSERKPDVQRQEPKTFETAPQAPPRWAYEQPEEIAKIAQRYELALDGEDEVHRKDLLQAFRKAGIGEEQAQAYLRTELFTNPRTGNYDLKRTKDALRKWDQVGPALDKYLSTKK